MINKCIQSKTLHRLVAGKEKSGFSQTLTHKKRVLLQKNYVKRYESNEIVI